MNYTVALIFSNWTVTKLYEFFHDYLDAEKSDVGMTKIERFRNKTGEMKDSNRTLILMSKTLYDKALKHGLDMQQPNLDFRISEFVLQPKYFPYEGYTNNFYIIIPATLSTAEAESLIGEKLRIFTTFGLLQEQDYTLRIPLNSRITGEHRGYALLNFVESVDVKNRSIIKALMNDSLLFIDTQNQIHHLPVFWTKKKLPSVPTFKILKRE